MQRTPNVRVRSSSRSLRKHDFWVSSPSFALQDDDKQAKPVAKAWLYPELPWGAPPGWANKNQRGKTFLRVWDVVTFLGCIHVAISVPYYVGFEDARWVPGQETCVFMDMDTGLKITSGVLAADLPEDMLSALLPTLILSLPLTFTLACSRP